MNIISRHFRHPPLVLLRFIRVLEGKVHTNMKIHSLSTDEKSCEVSGASQQKSASTFSIIAEVAGGNTKWVQTAHPA